MEPFDDSVPEMLGRAGVYSHLASDHYHYWEDGGATYHNRYNTWEFFRGQEGDAWIGQVADPAIPSNALGRHTRADRYVRQDLINRKAMIHESSHPQARTFAAGLDFIQRNRDEDRWFLQIETFYPHEPFFSHRRYKDLYDYGRQDWLFDWPVYTSVDETPEQVNHIRHEYAALLSQCDAYLGDLLDAMDAGKLWDDTLLVVWTDHGFLLGEHNSWAKVWTPYYQEIAHTPFFIWDPRCAKRGVRRQSLVQPSIDLGPTLLDFFGLDPPPRMLGKPLGGTVENDDPVRDAAIFGMFGAQVNATDGRYVYMRGMQSPQNQPLNNYTLMPTAMRGFLPLEKLRRSELVEPFSFTKETPVLKIPADWSPAPRSQAGETLLWDIETDPQQLQPINNPAMEARMARAMVELMRQCDAPREQYTRLGLQEVAGVGE